MMDGWMDGWMDARDDTDGWLAVAGAAAAGAKNKNTKEFTASELDSYRDAKQASELVLVATITVQAQVHHHTTTHHPSTSTTQHTHKHTNK